MTHKQMMDWILFQTFVTTELIYNLTLEIYASLPMCVCFFKCCISQIGCWDPIQLIFSKNIVMYDIFKLLLSNNEHFDQKWNHILFFNIFLKKWNKAKVAKGIVI